MQYALCITQCAHNVDTIQNMAHSRSPQIRPLSACENSALGKHVLGQILSFILSTQHSTKFKSKNTANLNCVSKDKPQSEYDQKLYIFFLSFQKYVYMITAVLHTILSLSLAIKKKSQELPLFYLWINPSLEYQTNLFSYHSYFFNPVTCH